MRRRHPPGDHHGAADEEEQRKSKRPDEAAVEKDREREGVVVRVVDDLAHLDVKDFKEVHQRAVSEFVDHEARNVERMGMADDFISIESDKGLARRVEPVIESAAEKEGERGDEEAADHEDHCQPEIVPPHLLAEVEKFVAQAFDGFRPGRLRAAPLVGEGRFLHGLQPRHQAIGDQD